MSRGALLMAVYRIAKDRGPEWEIGVLRPLGRGARLMFLDDRVLRLIVGQWG